MQAIEVKTLPATSTKPARLKAIACGGMTITESVSCHQEPNEQARNLAQKLANQLQGHAGINGEGVLRNGNRVYTLAPRFKN